MRCEHSILLQLQWLQHFACFTHGLGSSKYMGDRGLSPGIGCLMTAITPWLCIHWACLFHRLRGTDLKFQDTLWCNGSQTCKYKCVGTSTSWPFEGVSAAAGVLQQGSVQARDGDAYRCFQDKSTERTRHVGLELLSSASVALVCDCIVEHALSRSPTMKCIVSRLYLIFATCTGLALY